jgi:Mrp family chromosome partitioning ATPase
MLQTFLTSTTKGLRDLHIALGVGNLAGLQAAAHKMRPSLRHLQIQSALEMVNTLDNWSGPFAYDDLQPLVESVDRVLSQVLVEMTAEVENRRTEGY